MKPTITLAYIETTYNAPVKTVLVYADSLMGPAQRGDGEWEYFDVCGPDDDIIQYGVDKDGFPYALTASQVWGVGRNGCMINGKWYNREERLRIRALDAQ